MAQCYPNMNHWNMRFSQMYKILTWRPANDTQGMRPGGPLPGWLVSLGGRIVPGMHPVALLAWVPDVPGWPRVPSMMIPGSLMDSMGLGGPMGPWGPWDPDQDGSMEPSSPSSLSGKIIKLFSKLRQPCNNFNQIFECSRRIRKEFDPIMRSSSRFWVFPDQGTNC